VRPRGALRTGPWRWPGPVRGLGPDRTGGRRAAGGGARLRVRILDWQAAMGGPGSMVAWRLHDPPLAAADLLHFTPAGYALAADRFLAALEATRER